MVLRFSALCYNKSMNTKIMGKKKAFIRDVTVRTVTPNEFQKTAYKRRK